MTAEDVANFLHKIGLPQYSNTVKDNEISGDVLLGMDVESMSELGVHSSLHQMKIMELFPRDLQGTEAKYSNNHLSEFLRRQQMISKYIPILKEHGIDGDMILHVEKDLMKTVLNDIGITSLHQKMICSKYKTYVETC